MTLKTLEGKVWLFGDNIDTDTIYPGRYLHILDKTNMKEYAFADLRNDFYSNVQVNDILIAGRNFGCGSSREHAVFCLKESGIGAICALSFGRIFYRNAINNALPVLTFDIYCKNKNKINDILSEGDVVKLNFKKNILYVYSSGHEIKLQPIPHYLLEIIEDGGLIANLKKRLKI